MSVKSKIQALITAANTVTSESDTDMTSAVQHLIDGYGQGGAVVVSTDNGDGTQNLSIIDDGSAISLPARSITANGIYDPEDDSALGYGVVTVNVQQSTPIEINTDAGMTAILISANIGHCYKFTGTTGTYINGDLYVVDTDSGSYVFRHFAIASGGRLPAGYTELEYIQSSGTQYINTGLSFDTYAYNQIWESKFKFDSISNTTYAMGCYGNSNYDYFGATSTTWRAQMGSSAKTGGTSDTDKHTFILDFAQQKLTVDGTDVLTSISTSANVNTVNILLFGRWDGSGTSGLASGKMYTCKIYNGSTLVRDFVPAKNSSNVVGLYDLITRTFFTNNGSGNFTAGPSV